VALTAEAHGVFDQIKQAVDQINDMATQIASAAEEQHQVSAGINVNIEAIHGAANEVNRVSSAVADNADRQARLARELNGLVDQFRI
jgi:methyl-accepting chemotaxis protein